MRNSTDTNYLLQVEEDQILKEFENFILLRDHPCIMAQSIFSSKNLNFHVYPSLGSKETASLLLKDLRGYLNKYDEDSKLVYTFLAVFKGRSFYSEKEYEQLLWQQLQYLHEADNKPWDREVDSDPESADFSFSLEGKAFYMVGMHPNSSRRSRQAPYPAIAFNLHLQFEQLREKGRYEKVKQRIRERDIELQGNINPMLEDFHEGSEARQYSGRKVGEEWKCPFLHKKNKNVPSQEISENR